ncbi:hypothetical protein P4V41_19465 [Fictibacillus nanhaiensis]|uniref:hypothetical protein n=1 Tax=Fictibacillus nanhaiensis TaxID=742169 RepID=UPI002E1FA987|nr:hypothetical protein [Fictibacillus nanhaiensis]
MGCKNNKKKHPSLFENWHGNWCNHSIEDSCCNRMLKDCEESSFFCYREHDEVLGYVSFSAPTTSGTQFAAGATIPLNNTVFAQNIGVSPIGGLVVNKSGNYGITFNANLANLNIPSPTFEIYASSRLIATATIFPDTTLAKVANITQLEKNEVLQVRTPTGAFLYDANLTAAKLN